VGNFFFLLLLQFFFEPLFTTSFLHRAQIFFIFAFQTLLKLFFLFCIFLKFKKFRHGDVELALRWFSDFLTFIIPHHVVFDPVLLLDQLDFKFFCKRGMLREGEEIVFQSEDLEEKARLAKLATTKKYDFIEEDDYYPDEKKERLAKELKI
jgi:hypothetical protein